MAPLLLAVLLSPPLETWRGEIETAGKQSVILLRLQPGEPVPETTPHRAILLQFTDNPNFQEQFQRAQALSITYQGSEGRLSFVLVNPRQTPPEDEPYVLAHEFGHLWLKAQRYPAPAYLGGPSSCLSIHAGDAVQHVLIRAEMDRRGIPWRPVWVKTLEAALASLEAPGDPPRPTRCEAVARAVLWIDVFLGVRSEDWKSRDAFLALLTRRSPVIQPAAEDLAKMLGGRPLEDRGAHQQALATVFNRLKEMALTLSN